MSLPDGSPFVMKAMVLLRMAGLDDRAVAAVQRRDAMEQAPDLVAYAKRIEARFFPAKG